MNRIIRLGIALLAVMGIWSAGWQPAYAAPVDVFPLQCQTQSAVCSNAGNQKLFGEGSVWNRILNAFIYVIGAISILMVVVGGFRYVTSSGESAAVTGAKNTILYAIIGLIVAGLSYSIINFVLGKL